MKQTDNYVYYNGDCVEVTKQLKTDSIDLTITSVPFANLYTYSGDIRDFSNVESVDQFFTQMDYLIPELYRVTKPGRIVALHCKQIATFKGRDGAMGLVDFRGDLIRAFQKHGFVYHGEILVWKDPQLEATRTKSASLLYNSFKKYAEITRTSMPDYVVLMQKCEREDEWVHVKHDETDESFKSWTRIASSCWGLGDKTPQVSQTRVLNSLNASSEKDERHLTPLQLDLIEHLIYWYTNENEVVFDCFGGIGSTCYQALKMNRKAVGIELKEEYYNQAIKFLDEAEKNENQMNIFDLIDEVDENDK